MEPNPTSVRKMLQTRLLARARDDAGFHDRLMRNPRAAFEEEIGVALPSSAKLHVIEEPVDTLVIVLPKAPTRGTELSGADLGAVVGGAAAGGSVWSSLHAALGGGSGPA